MKSATRPQVQPWRLRIALLATFVGASFFILAFEGSPLPDASSNRSRMTEQIDQIKAELSRTNFQEPGRVRDEIRSVASRAPLAALPFYAAALELDEARETSEIIALLDQAIQRDPRHSYARTWRARLYFRTGRPRLAAEEIDMLVGIDPARAAFYVDALVDLARERDGQAAVLSRLDRSPPWAGDFARRAVETLGDDDFLAAMAQRSKVAFDIYVNKLAASGDIERAFLIWQSRLSTAELLQFSWPFDRRFDRASEAGVFGWSIASTLAQRSRSGLQVFYSGTGKPQIASQSLLLGPGYDYRLQVTATSQVEDDGGYFALALACRQTGMQLGEITLAATGPEPKVLSKLVSVPREACPLQTLTLVGRPGEKALRARATVHEVSIQEIGPTPERSGADAATPPEPARKSQP